MGIPAAWSAVPERTRRVPVDYASLAEFLAALAYPARLELLDRLRFPHTLSEIRLAARRGPDDGGEERVAARQTVQGHLDKLAEAGLVELDRVERDGREMPTYVVSPPKLYAITEELRRLSTMYAGTGGTGDATGTLVSGAPAEEATGPRLVLVHGVYEGKVYPLDKATAVEGRWTIGRKRGLPVALDYDPFVSLENAHVEKRAGRFVLIDEPRSKNGTSVNWRLLPPGGSRALKPGDIVGVGRTLLAYAAD